MTISDRGKCFSFGKVEKKKTLRANVNEYVLFFLQKWAGESYEVDAQHQWQA